MSRKATYIEFNACMNKKVHCKCRHGSESQCKSDDSFKCVSIATNTALMTDHGRHGETWNIPLNVKCLQPVRSLTAGIMETRCAYMEELLHVCQVSLVHVKLYYIYIFVNFTRRSLLTAASAQSEETSTPTAFILSKAGRDDIV